MRPRPLLPSVARRRKRNIGLAGGALPRRAASLAWREAETGLRAQLQVTLTGLAGRSSDREIGSNPQAYQLAGLASNPICPHSTAMSRPLTPGETALARTVFGNAIDYARVRIHRRKWAFFQPRHIVMAPMGHIHFHPEGSRYRDDFAAADLQSQALFIHEMVHVWQHQRGIFLPLRRLPWARYDYVFTPGRPLARYGIEQQAMLVQHAFQLRHGGAVPGAPPPAQIEAILPF